MREPDPPARLAPLDRTQFDEEAKGFFKQWTGGIFKNADRNPVLRTFARNPPLADAFSHFNVHILSANSLPVKLRQIAIMRTAWMTGAVYMWSSHLNTSVMCGLSPEMYGPIQAGPDDPYFDPLERAVVRATDDLVLRHEVSDENWSALMSQWDDRQMLDFLFTVGCYVAIAGVMRSIGVEREQNLLELAERYGAPEAG